MDYIIGATPIPAAINGLVKRMHDVSKVAGWWTAKDGTALQSNPLTFSNKCMLIVTEVSEAVEGDRKDKMDDHLPHRKAIEVELADALIRILDLAGAYNLDLGGATLEKMEYNLSRQDHKKEAREGLNGKKY